MERTIIIWAALLIYQLLVEPKHTLAANTWYLLVGCLATRAFYNR